MNKAKAEADNRNIILKTAARVFAENGFDGARVDEIARKAKVNKALIYYYFKSKEDILSVLFREVLEASARFMESPLFATLEDHHDEEKLAAYLGEFVDFLEERQDILRVMLMESLKRSPVNDLVFTFIGEIMQRMVDQLETFEKTRVNPSQVMVTEFFTGLMPIINFVVYHETWMKRFGVSEPELRRMFFKIFLGTHVDFSFHSYWQEKGVKDGGQGNKGKKAGS